MARSIRTQLIILLFGLTAISIAVVSYLGVDFLVQSGHQAEAITSDAMRQRVEQFLVQTTKATAAKNGLIFDHIQHQTDAGKKVVANLFDNPSQFNNSGWKFDAHVFKNDKGQYVNPKEDISSIQIPGLNQTRITPSFKQTFERSAYLDNVFPALLSNEPTAIALYYTEPEEAGTRYYPNIGLGEIVPADYTPLSDVFYPPVTPQNDPGKTSKWTATYDDPAGNGLMITHMNPVYGKNGNFLGAVCMDVQLSKIAVNIENYTPIETSYAFLIDNAGRAIALPAEAYKDILGRTAKKDEFGPDLQKVGGDFGKVLGDMRAGKSGFSPVKTKNNELYVAYAPIDGTPFSLAIAAKQSVLLKVVSDLQNQVRSTTSQMIYGRVLPIGVGLLVVLWAYGFIYIKRFIDPLNKLAAKTAQLSTGNFNVEPEVVHMENEIGKLAGSFNDMVADLKASHAKIEDQNRALMREQSRLQASIKSLPFGFAIINPDNEIVFHNGVLAKLFGRPIPDDLPASKAVLELINKDFEAAIDLLECIRTSQGQNKPIERNVELGPRFYRFLFRPIIDETAKEVSQSIGVVLIMEDTTDARAMERSRDEFFSIASHELRTPLTAIRGNADMIMNYYKEAIKDPSLKEMVGDIHESSTRLITIVNDFLDTSRLEQGKMVFKLANFDAEQMVRKVLREFDVSGSRNKLALHLAPVKGKLPLVYGDVDRTRQILVNLISNAIKFTDKGGVTVSLIVLPKKLKISVSDTGHGIPVESQHLLFRKFQQASNNILTRDNTRSTGLGLYISSLIAESMNGRLYLDKTEVGKGSIFSLELPSAKGDKAE